MSNVDEIRHNVFVYSKGEKLKPLSGQVLLKAQFNDSEKKGRKAEHPNAYASVPPITEEEVFSADFVPILLERVNELRQALFRNLWAESRKGGKDGMSSVSTEDICAKSVLSFWQAQNEGERISKARIEAWFDSYASENLTAILAEKMGKPEDDGAVFAQNRIYRSICLMMVDGGMTAVQLNQVKKVCELAEESFFGSLLESKVTEILEAQERAKSMEIVNLD